MILVDANRLGLPPVKLPARTAARCFGHFEWLVNGVDGAYIRGRVPASFRGRRGLSNASQRREERRHQSAFVRCNDLRPVEL